MQMGVTTVMVVEPVSADARAALKKIDRVTPIAGKVDGSGPVFAFSHNSNAAMKSVNDILNAGGTVSFGKSDSMIYAGGNAGPTVHDILHNNGVDAKSLSEAPANFAAKKIRVGLYEPWAGNIDEGWTKWILEQFHFPFTVMHNDDVQAGHLRSKFDSIVLAEMGARQIVEGMQPGTVPGRYAGGIGDDGVEALRQFVEEGGTLITLGNASQFAIDRFGLPVTNVVALVVMVITALPREGETIPDLKMTRAYAPDSSDEELLSAPSVLSGTPREMADTLSEYREKYGLTCFTVQDNHIENFAKVIAELR